MKIKEIKSAIEEMRKAGKTYQYIGDVFEVNKAIIYRVHKSDYEPKRKDIRRKLGLEDTTIDFVRQVRNINGRFAKEDENARSI